MAKVKKPSAASKARAKASKDIPKAGGSTTVSTQRIMRAVKKDAKAAGVSTKSPQPKQALKAIKAKTKSATRAVKQASTMKKAKKK